MWKNMTVKYSIYYTNQKRVFHIFQKCVLEYLYTLYPLYSNWYRTRVTLQYWQHFCNTTSGSVSSFSFMFRFVVLCIIIIQFLKDVSHSWLQ